MSASVINKKKSGIGVSIVIIYICVHIMTRDNGITPNQFHIYILNVQLSLLTIITNTDNVFFFAGFHTGDILSGGILVEGFCPNT